MTSLKSSRAAAHACAAYACDEGTHLTRQPQQGSPSFSNDGEGAKAPGQTPATGYRMSMKVSIESSRASHHFVWWAGAFVPVTGEACE